MTACRRKAFEAVTLENCGNPGLAFYRFLKSQEKGEKKDVPELLEAIRTGECPKAYAHAFTAWQSTSASLGTTVVRAECRTPLALGLGNESPLEVGFTFHHTYGMPMIPGSAIKGLVRRALAAADRTDAIDGLLGKQEQAGACVFFDAWYDPASVSGKPFHRDVVTVHHPEYYRTRGKKPPTDMDDPTPVPFLVVRPGATFHVAILAPSAEQGKLVVDALAWAMEHLGVGAKTNSGYGRMTLGSGTKGGGGVMQAESEVWQSVNLTLSPGPQEVNTSNGDLRGSAKLAALADCPESIREALQGKARQARANVTVEPLGGKNYKIIKIEEATDA